MSPCTSLDDATEMLAKALKKLGHAPSVVLTVGAGEYDKVAYDLKGRLAH